jgi:hypothetical protein
MYARVTIISGSSQDKLDDGIANFRAEVLPAVREMGGRGALMLVDRATGNGMGITLWPDEDSLRASEERANELRARVTEEMGTEEQPRVERYEIAVFET